MAVKIKVDGTTIVDRASCVDIEAGDNVTLETVRIPDAKSAPYVKLIINSSGNGEPGADGKTILNGTAGPVEEGEVGDFYLKTDTSDLYGPKTEEGWGEPVSLLGAKGETGAAGADGRTLLNGTAVPTTEGELGDFYLKTDTSDLYGPKTEEGWGDPVSLLGEKGETGEPGLTYEGAWDNQTEYTAGQVVSHEGACYVALQTGTGQEPAPGGTAYWDELAVKGDTGETGIVGAWKGQWSDAIEYVPGDVVSHEGACYVAIDTGTGQTPAPGGTAYWDEAATKGVDAYAAHEVCEVTTAVVVTERANHAVGQPVIGDTEPKSVNTITDANAETGDTLSLWGASDTETVTLTCGGNIRTADGNPYILNTVNYIKFVLLADTNWHEVERA